MKVRDLGKAILDFELSVIPKSIKTMLIWVFALATALLCGAVSLYKSLSSLIIIASLIIFVSGLEKDCVDYCYGLIELYSGYSIEEENLLWAVSLIVALIISHKLDNKLSSIKVC